MTNSGRQAIKPRKKAIAPRRITRSARKGLPHLELGTKNTPITLYRKPKMKVSDFWVETSRIHIISSDSEPAQSSEPESDPSEGSWNEDQQAEPQIPHDTPSPKLRQSPVIRINLTQKDKADEDYNEAESTYKPVKYPIFPELYWEPEEEEKDHWEFFGSTGRLVLTAPKESPRPINAPEPVILLRGKDTEYPGSPGRLPETIPYRKWWDEARDPNQEYKGYMSLVQYSELTWHKRIPVNPNQKSKPSTSSTWYSDILFAAKPR